MSGLSEDQECIDRSIDAVVAGRLGGWRPDGHGSFQSGTILGYDGPRPPGPDCR